MRAVSVTEAKNRLSALLDEVKSGGGVLITDRGRAVARLESVVGDPQRQEGRIDRLERAGVLRRGRGRSRAEILDEEPPDVAGPGVLEALLEERRDGR